jgi:uncharacterized protein (TIGR03437 family)
LFGTELAGVTAVLVADRTGSERPATILASVATQVNFLLPAGLTPGPAVVRFIRGSLEIARMTFEVASVSPGIFTANANGMGAPAALVVRTAADGAQTVAPVFTCGASPGTCRPAPIDMSLPGIYDLIVFGTGIRGRTSVQGVLARIGEGRFFGAQFAGPQGEYPGLDQVNVRLQPVLRGIGEVDLELTLDGRVSNRTRLLFQ